ncbi:MAG: SagB/ThcOx family dehydrogenase [Theionarchaea archaeon]|nr:SagB/ThcOx family dehydrogenase [Theionarchaea archaeon]
MNEEIGDRFQKETKYTRERTGGYLDQSRRPDKYKVYDDSTRIELPPLPVIPSITLDDTLRKRKSIRQFSQEPLTLEEVSYLLWASTGIQREEYGYELRTAPSAGALYPLETYLIINRVEGLSKGLFHYRIKEHALEEVKLGDFGEKITSAALGQAMCSECAAVFAWTAIFYRSKWKYRQRAYRYVYMDMGHVGQNLALAAVSLGLGSCQIGAFYDDEVNTLLAVDGFKESAIYLSVVGHLQL